VTHVTIAARAETWPLAQAFVISRGSKTAAEVVVVEARLGSYVGRGEAVPYARYGETAAGVLGAIATAAADFPTLVQHPPDVMAHIQASMAPGAARNAIDCALWDLAGKCAGTRVAKLAGFGRPAPCLTAYTLSLDTPQAMAAKARSVATLPLLKLKLGGPGDAVRIKAVRAARPDARLIVDANEAWTVELLPELMAASAESGVEVIEQPLPAAHDEPLRHIAHSVPVCADESLHTRADLPRLAGLYDAINIKLDKAGGLTEALALSQEARALGLKIMVGCMVATSLAMAPALLLAQTASWVDLDGPLLLARDREGGLAIADGLITPASPELWG